MSIKDLSERAKGAASDAAGKAGDIAGTVRHKVGDAAEVVVGKVDDLSGGRVPTAVKNAVDKIDGQADDQAEAVSDATEPTEAGGEDADGSES